MLLTYFYLLYLFTLSYIYLVTVRVSTKGSPKVDVILWWIQTLTSHHYVTQSRPSVQSSASFCIFPLIFNASLIKPNHISNLTALGRKSWVLLI